MEQTRCVNLDWLEVYAMEDTMSYPMDAEYFRGRGYIVHEREYGTRVYAQMFTIDDKKGDPFIEVRRSPLSSQAKDGGLFPKESCHLRLTNNACYSPDPIGRLRKFMVDNGYSLVRIFRIDIAMDFTRFDRGDDPARFVRRYIAGKYTKVNQSNIAAHGKDTWEQRVFNSISWGAKKSMIGTKMYNKSLELEEVKDKPYIRWCWYLAGLITDPISGKYMDENGTITKPDVWRVEFSIKSSTKKWFVMEDCNHSKRTSVYIPHTLDMYDTKEKLLVVFASLAHRYFHFKKFQEGVRKDRCEDKVLFVFNPSDKIYQPKGNVATHDTEKDLDRLIRYLQQYKEKTVEDTTKTLIEKLLKVLRTKQIRNFVGNNMDEETVITLQRLISERIGRLNDAGKEQARKEIKNLVHGYFGGFW